MPGMLDSHKIKRARPQDLPDIAKLLKNSNLPIEGIEDIEFWIVRVDPEGALNACVGLEVHGRDALLRSLAVKNEFQRGGIGSALVLHVISTVRERKFRNLFLLTEGAKDFFPRFGFIPFAREDPRSKEIMKSREFGACPDTSSLMRLEI